MSTAEWIAVAALAYFIGDWRAKRRMTELQDRLERFFVAVEEEVEEAEAQAVAGNG